MSKTKWYAKALYFLVALALVTLMVPAVNAEIIDSGGDKASGAPELTGFHPQFVNSATSGSYTVTIEDEGITIAASGELADAAVIYIPKSAGLAVWSSTIGITATVVNYTGTGIPGTEVTTINDASTPPQVAEIHIKLKETGTANSTTITEFKVEFTSSSPSVGTDQSYIWDVDMNDGTDTATGKAKVTVDPTSPTIAAISGTSYQNGRDAIVITFSEAVAAADGSFDHSNEFAYIKCGETELTLSANTGFTLDTTKKILTITLDEATDGVWLTNGDYIKVKPATYAAGATGISDLALKALSDAEQSSAQVVSGDSVAPTVPLTYGPDRAVKDADTLNITATFSEAMQDTPQIAIVAEDLTELQAATDMAMPDTDRKVWKLANWNVPADHDGTATVTITGKDLAGNDVDGITDDTFVIDNTAPTIAPANIVGTTKQGEGDTIIITFFEAVTPEDGDWADKDDFTILSGTRTLTLATATIGIDATNTTLTITLNETTDLAYLVNGEMITVTPVGGANDIQDAALNDMLSGADNKIVGTTPVSGDVVVPTITNIVGTDAGPDTIDITFSESVVAADGTWSPNEFALIENPDHARLNINHAAVAADGDPGSGMAVVLTITLDNNVHDFAELDVTKAICVTPATGAIVDLAGWSVAATEVCSSSIGAAAPTITSIVGTTIQDAGDTIVITFSEAVTPAETAPKVWSTNEIASSINITTAVFSINDTNTILTITLDEATDGAYLVNGNTFTVTPASEAIKDADGNFVPNTAVTSAAVSGETTPPTIDSIVGTIIPGSTASDKDIIRIDFSEAVVPADAWSGEDELDITNVDLTAGGGAVFDPADGITTTLTITLGTGEDLTAGDTLTVTPVKDKVLDLARNKMLVESTCSGVVSQSYAIDLVAGWNLISLPLIPTNSSIETETGETGVLADLIAAGTVNQVRTWVWELEDGVLVLNEKAWLGVGSGNLATMVDGQGYWIEMNTADVLVVNGTEHVAPPLTPHSYDVCTGWNMIGFKSLTETTATLYLGPAVIDTMEAMYGYDAAAGIYTIIQAATNLVPGDGYWLAVNAPGTIYP